MDRYIIKIDERLKKRFIKMQKSFNRMCSYNLWPEHPDTMESAVDDSFREIITNIDKLTNALQDILPNGIRDMVNYNTIKATGEKLSEAVNAYAEYAGQPHQLSKIDFSPVFFREFINSYCFKDLISAAYKVTQEMPGKIADEGNALESEFSNTEELEDDIHECINSSKDSWKETDDWLQKRKGQYFKIWQILCFLCACFIQLYIQGNISLPVKADKAINVRRQPRLNAEIICLLKENIEAIIIEDTIRYYRIAFIDEDGIKREGYVSKKSVKLLNEEI